MKIKFFYHPILICIKPPVLSTPDLLCLENHLESINIQVPLRTGT